jgi:hypothetical protein
MKAVGAALRDATAITEQDVYGEASTALRFDPIGRATSDQWLPTQIAGISAMDLQTLNTLFTGGYSATLYESTRGALRTAGIDGKALNLYRPGADPAERERLGFAHRIQAEDPNPPVRRPDVAGRLRSQLPAVLAGVTSDPLPSAPPADTISVTTLSHG